MSSNAGQMGGSKSFFTKKIPGFSAGFAKKESGILSKGFSAKTSGGALIKGPRQAKGSKGDGMNGGY